MQTVTLDQLQSKSIMDEAEKLVALIQEGIKAWNRAGAVLIELLNRDPDVFAKIHAAHPHISMATLHVFARIGYGQVYPPLLLDTSPGAQKLLECTRKLQEQFMDEPVEVALEWKGGKIRSVKKKVNELTRAEAALVFKDGEMRNLEQQAFALKQPKESKADTFAAVPARKNIDLGYYSVRMDADGVVRASPCKPSSIAQPVRMLPAADGTKHANIVFYFQQPI